MLSPVTGLRERLAVSIAAFKAVFSNPSLRSLELAWTISIVGHWAYLDRRVGVRVRGGRRTGRRNRLPAATRSGRADRTVRRVDRRSLSPRARAARDECCPHRPHRSRRRLCVRRHGSRGRLWPRHRRGDRHDAVSLGAGGTDAYARAEPDRAHRRECRGERDREPRSLHRTGDRRPRARRSGHRSRICAHRGPAGGLVDVPAPHPRRASTATASGDRGRRRSCPRRSRASARLARTRRYA